MTDKIELQELLTYLLLESCIEHQKKKNVKESGHYKKQVALEKIRDEYLEKQIDKFLSEQLGEESQ